MAWLLWKTGEQKVFLTNVLHNVLTNKQLLYCESQNKKVNFGVKIHYFDVLTTVQFDKKKIKGKMKDRKTKINKTRMND